MTNLEAASFWLIAYCVGAPFLAAAAVAVYYRLRYREGITMQRHYDKGLFQ